ncbi:MAG: aldehyde dehydrogenase family protein [Verrucomicrobiaceae bacterium]|nr:aldehyde dehydrogenase family protein [Verrucomicrobiaceae bacterium]
MKFYLNGNWESRDQVIEVTNPYDNSIVDVVPKATEADIETALQSAVKGAASMAETTGYERFEILRRTAGLIQQRSEDLAQLLSKEEGKTLSESRLEVDRSVQTMELSGEEAKRISGEQLPLDGGKDVRNRLGFTLRVPCGVVVAISPFNFPLNLVCHKVGPALAAGNAVILKPASDTPLVSLELVKILLEAGLPPLGIQCLTGSGAVIGGGLCADPRVRKITFTGSREVGEDICRVAGLKKVTMELGSNCPLIVLPDADLDAAAQAVAVSGYANAGQVCISTQRLIVADEIHEAMVDRLQTKIATVTAGNQLDATTTMGPMVRTSDAERVQNWISQAVDEGARLVCGGERDGAVMQATLLNDTTSAMKINREELFGPAVTVMKAKDVHEAIRLANDTEYGLSAGVFTQDIDAAMCFAREVQSGNIHIHWSPFWRTDLMPYGGLKGSGMGKEGPKYAVEAMTETKAVVIHTK